MIPLILTVLLAHSDFAVRESASESLARMGPVALPALIWGMSSSDPERARRAAQLRDLAVASLADWMLADGMPYLDSLEGIAYAEYVRLAQQLGYASQLGRDWPAYRYATKLWLSDQLKSGRHPESLREVIAKMQARSRCYDRTGKWEE